MFIYTTGHRPTYNCRRDDINFVARTRRAAIITSTFVGHSIDHKTKVTGEVQAGVMNNVITGRFVAENVYRAGSVVLPFDVTQGCIGSPAGAGQYLPFAALKIEMRLRSFESKV